MNNITNNTTNNITIDNTFDIHEFEEYCCVLDNEQYEELFDNMIQDRMIIHGTDYHLNKICFDNINIIISEYTLKKYRYDANDYCNIGAKIMLSNGLETEFKGHTDFILNEIEHHRIREIGWYNENMVPFIKIDDISKYVKKTIDNKHKYNKFKTKFTKKNINDYIESLNDVKFISFITKCIHHRLNNLEDYEFYTKYMDIAMYFRLIEYYKKQNINNAYQFYNKYGNKYFGRRIQLINKNVEAILKKPPQHLNTEYASIIVYKQYNNTICSCKWDEFVVLDNANDIINKLFIKESNTNNTSKRNSFDYLDNVNNTKVTKEATKEVTSDVTNEVQTNNSTKKDENSIDMKEWTVIEDKQLHNNDSDVQTRVGMKWTENEDNLLMEYATQGMDINEIAKKHKRTATGVKMRIMTNALLIVKQDIMTMEEVSKYVNISLHDLEEFNKKQNEKNNNNEKVSNNKQQQNQKFKEKEPIEKLLEGFNEMVIKLFKK